MPFPSHFSPEPRRACAAPVRRVAEGVVLAGADLPAVPSEGVDGAGPVAVEARVAGLADAGTGPRMTTETRPRICQRPAAC